MGHAEMVDDAALRTEPIETGTRRLESTHHGDVVGGGQQQWSAVGIAVADDGVDLEDRMGGIGRIDHPAVVDDVFEHRQRTDAHQAEISGEISGAVSGAVSGAMSTMGA